MTENNESHGAKDDGEYDVGYGKPPEHSRFKKGESGNPKGRPRGAKNFSTDLREELNEKVPVRENGKVKKLTKQRAIVKGQVNKAMSGDGRAADIVFKMAAASLGDDMEADLNTPLSADDEKLIEAAIADVISGSNKGGNDVK